MTGDFLDIFALIFPSFRRKWLYYERKMTCAVCKRQTNVWFFCKIKYFCMIG